MLAGWDVAIVGLARRRGPPSSGLIGGQRIGGRGLKLLRSLCGTDGVLGRTRVTRRLSGIRGLVVLEYCCGALPTSQRDDLRDESLPFTSWRGSWALRAGRRAAWLGCLKSLRLDGAEGGVLLHGR